MHESTRVAPCFTSSGRKNRSADRVVMTNGGRSPAVKTSIGGLHFPGVPNGDRLSAAMPRRGYDSIHVALKCEGFDPK